MAPKSKTLETEVAVLFRALGYKVEPEPTVGRQNFDMLVRHNVPGLGEHVSFLECIDHKSRVMRSRLQEILYRFKQVSESEDVDISVKNARLVIVSVSGFSKGAKEDAVSQGIICYSLDELRAQVIDFPAYVKTFLNEPQPDSFINLLATEDMDVPAEHSREVVLVDAILSTLEKPKIRSILLNGRAGSGKTHTMRKIASALADNYLLDPTGAFIPILIQLRKISETHSLNDEITNILGGMSNSKFTEPLIKQFQSSGKFVYLLDGFDEIPLESTDQVLSNVMRLFENNYCKIIVSQRRRSQFYASNALENIFIEKGTVTLNICDLDQKQFSELMLKKGMTSFLDWSELHSLIPAGFANPMMASLFAHIYESTGIIPTLNKTQLLETFVKLILNRDSQKGTRFQLNPNTVLSELETFASTIFVIPDNQFLVDSTVLLPNPLLVIDHNSRLKFSHRLFFEYFLARAVLTEITSGIDRTLRSEHLPHETVEFLADMDFSSNLLDKFLDEISGPPSTILQSNIALIKNFLNAASQKGSSSIRILSLKLQNIKCFKKLEIDFCPKDGENNNLSLLIGNNGVGKTTILQAISLCAVGPVLANKLIAKPDRLLRNEQLSGYLSAVFEVTGREHKPKKTIQITLDVRRGKKEFSLRKRGPDKSRNHREYLEQKVSSEDRTSFIGAYGASRSFDNASDPIDIRETDAVLSRLNSIFTSESALLDPMSLARILSGDGSSFGHYGAPQKISKKIMGAVSQLLISLLPDNDEVAVTKKGKLKGSFGSVDLTDLSDGYKSTLAWAGHLLVNLLQSVSWNQDPSTVPCVVMIDEIDLHLHPKWQRVIVNQIVSAFPNTQFILSSHSPLVVADADAHDANCILLENQSGEVHAHQNGASSKGLNASQVLASELFGYIIDRDPKTENALKQLSILAGKGSKRSKEEEEVFKALLDNFPTESLLDGRTAIERKIEADDFLSMASQIEELEQKIKGKSDD